METRWLIVFLITIIGCDSMEIEETMSKNCSKKLHELAQVQRQFVGCTTNYGVPVKLCTMCADFYHEMTNEFAALKNDENCSRAIFEHDRLNIVGTANQILTSLWTKPLCDLCYIGNNSGEFRTRSDEVDSCFKRNENSKTVCRNCINEYTILNEFYIKLDQHNNGQVCYDLQDSMNVTRMKWSAEYGCCHRPFDKTLFLVAVSFIGILPIIFYASAVVLTKRRERHHGLLNSDPAFSEPTSNEAQASGTSRITEDVERSPIASRTFQKPPNEENDESTDEDDNFYTHPIKDSKASSSYKQRSNSEVSTSDNDDELCLPAKPKAI